MKHQAEVELLKTLNGQLNELPGVAKQMVQQYQLSAIVTSVFCVVGLITIIAGTKLVVNWCKKQPDYDGDEDLIMIVMFGVCLSVIMSVILWINVVHACAPIYSIVQSILGH